MWKKALCVLLCITNPLDTYAKMLQKIETDESKVVGINTALGYSTILEFPSKPISAVLGDQDAFKVEYVGNAITIKPVIPHAKTNLFVFTENDRFNCTLRTGSALDVDYIVKMSPARPALVPVQPGLSQPAVPEMKFKTQRVQKVAAYGGYSLRVNSIGRTNGEGPSRPVVVLDFELQSKRKNYAFSPNSLGVRQAGKHVNIESIYLDSLQLLSRAQPIRGKIVLLSQELRASIPLTVVFAVPGESSKKKTHRLEVTIGKDK